MPTSIQAALPEAKLLSDLQRTQSNVSIGAYGCEHHADTAEHTAAGTDNYYAIIQATAAAVIMVEGDLLGGDFSAVPLPAGMAIYGYFRSFTLASGSVIAYLGKPVSV